MPPYGGISYQLFLLAGVLALLIGNAAAGLAGRLAGSLALAAAALPGALAKIAGFKSLDSFHNADLHFYIPPAPPMRGRRCSHDEKEYHAGAEMSRRHRPGNAAFPSLPDGGDAFPRKPPVSGNFPPRTANPRSRTATLPCSGGAVSQDAARPLYQWISSAVSALVAQSLGRKISTSFLEAKPMRRMALTLSAAQLSMRASSP